MALKCASAGNEFGSPWFLLLSQASKTCLASKAGIKRVHYKLPDGREMLEDWKMSEGKARELVGRYWRKKSIAGKQLAWDVEVGDSVQAMIESQQNSHLDENALKVLTIRESNANPIAVSRSTAACYEWRIRNLPPPAENYVVSLEPENYTLVISTLNRKYYKRLTFADLERLKVVPIAGNLVTSFANRTLIIQYKKPVEIIELEKKIWQEIISPLKAEGCKSPSGCSQA
jgi:hypothetical protein